MARVKTDRLTVVWEVEDGYCGGSAPQHCSIDHSEIHECDSLEAAKQLMEDSVMDGFRNKISWHYTDGEKMEAELEKIWNARPKEEETP